MMKFSQLTPGDTFLFKGVEYTKSGPLQAIDKITGAERVIMRSASVELAKNKMDDETLEQNAVAAKLAVVESVLTEYHRTCLSYLDDATNEQKRMQMEVLYKKIEEALDDIKRQFSIDFE